MAGIKENFGGAPTHLTAEAEALESGSGETRRLRLVVRGQGTVGFCVARMEPFTISFGTDGWGAPAFEWRVYFRGVTLRERAGGEWTEVDRVAGPNAGIDSAENCTYWFSLDGHN